MRRFITGFAKKVLIANVVAVPADGIFAMPAAQLSAGHAWLGLACYTLQIYFDFSGYSDMAIGLGRMFGFRFPENFRWPYIAGSVQDFWRRWHISLSSWFRDYLYVPLGGNRVPPGRMYRNLVTVFFLCGLWHGASWNFAIWGLWHGLFLVLERVSTRRPASERTHMAGPSSHTGAVARHVYTLLVVMIGWVFFRAETLPGAIAFLEALAGFSFAGPTPFTLQWHLTPELVLALAAGTIGSTPWIPALAARIDARARAGRPSLAWSLSLVSTGALIVLLVASIMQVAAQTYNPFIYFRF
jgi:alginate O-acetyltransferase complex protein AlgI